MKKIVSLIRAVCSQDMDLFRYKSKGNNLSKILLFSFLSLMIMIAFGEYYYLLGKELNKVNLTYLMLGISLVLPVVFIFIQGIYKSQNILFEAKDNELLMFLPISKGTIIFIRFFKMYLYELIYGLLFIIPAIVIYIYFVKVNILFYVITLLMILMLPIIPIVLSSLIGYVIKNISIRFKAKKLVQIIITFVMFFGIIYVSNNGDAFINKIVSNASNINEVITKIYYPIGMYVKLINNFNILDLILYLVINSLPVILFVYILNRSYFVVINKSKVNSYSNNKKYKYNKIGYMKALVIKEVKKYFSSPVYVFNTFFGLILLVVATIGLCTNFESTIKYILSGEIEGIDINMLYSIAPKVFFLIIMFISFMTSITSSSISIEGKSFNISKSLPIEVNKILYSKVIFSNLLVIPIMLLCDVIFFIYFKLEIIDYILIIFISIIGPIVSSLLGLIINLKYPKMDASNDTEVVKQSMSSMVAVFSGMIMSIIAFGLFVMAFVGYININLNVLLGLVIVCLIIVMFVLLFILNKYGVEKFKEIEC